MKNLQYLFLICLLGITACVEQMVMFPDDPPIDTERVVLLEELTGVDCPNCPLGAAQAAEILVNFPGRVVVVALHGDFLADPLSNSLYDFRSDEGEDLEDYLRPWDGKPAASINRTQFDGQSEFSNSTPGLWQSFVEDELMKPHVLDLTAQVNYNESTRTYEILVAASPRVDLEGDYNITAFITENDIVDAQKNQGSIIDDYVHKHVVRDIVTAFNGRALVSNPSQGQIINTTITGALEPEDGTWIAENMEVVLAIHRVDAGHKEVLQAFQAHLVE